MRTMKSLAIYLVFCWCPSVTLGQSLVTTLPPDSVTATSALLHGQFYNSRVGSQSVAFNSGLDRTYSAWLDLSPTRMIVKGDTTDFWCLLKGLLPGTTVHYQVYGRDTTVWDRWYYADDVMFRTLDDTNAGGFVSQLSLANDSGSDHCPVRFGVHTNATYCADVGIGEDELPPLPPSGMVDLRLVDPRGLSSCMDQGLRYDLRPYVSSSQVDTYEVSFAPPWGLYPATLSWSKLDNHYLGPVRLVDPYGGVLVSVDMKAETSFTATSGGINDLLIIAEGPTNLLAVTSNSICEDEVSLAGRFNPNGYETRAWFEWGPTSSYGNTTQSISIGSGTSRVGFVEKLSNLQPDTIYHFRAVTENAQGCNLGTDEWFETSALTSVTSAPQFVNSYRLHQNYPNPFNPTSTIEYSLPQKVFVTLKLYDLLGREVRTLVNGEQEPGNYSRIVDANGLPSGVYFYRLQAGNSSSSSGHGFTDIKKMLLMK